MDEKDLLKERVARLEVEVIALRKKVGVRRAYLPPWLRSARQVDFEQWVKGVRNPSPALPASGEGEDHTPADGASPVPTEAEEREVGDE